MFSTFRARMQKSLLTGMILSLLIAPPVLIPALRIFYAPVYDQFILPLVGYTWHLYYPYSALFLLPLVVFTIGLWIAWLFQFRMIHTAQLSLTRGYLHIQPDARAYQFFKRSQLFWITAVNRIKEPLRSWFPFSVIPHQYGLSTVSVYLSTVYQVVLQDWTKGYLLATNSPSRDLNLKRINKAHRGLAHIYVPSFTYMDQISLPNLVQAMTYLDNAQICGVKNWSRIQQIFRTYILRTAHFDVDNLTVHQMVVWLQSTSEIDRTIILRIFINLWFETRSPTIARLVIGQMSNFLNQVDQIIESRLNNVVREVADENPLPDISIRSFSARYIHFIEISQGAAAAIHLRDVLSNLGSSVSYLVTAEKNAASASASEDVLYRLVHNFSGLIPDAAGIQQATSWQSRYQHLHVFREAADEAMWTALYHTGQPETFEQMYNTETETTP